MIDTAQLNSLAESLTGEVVASNGLDNESSPTYFYGEYGRRRPRAVVRVAGAVDVATVVRYARDTGTSLAVRAGGHSIMGHSSTDGGLLLDLSRLKGIEVDPEARTAWADGGVLAGEYTAATGRHGLVTGFGDTPSVGVSGITLGGGVGFLHRKLGLTIDSLLAAEVVTADGEIRVVDDENEPDLFWALRGGGGNFGVVTKLQYRLHPIGTVLGGMMILPATPRSIADFVEIALEASDDLSVIGGTAVAPPAPFLPEQVHGKLILFLALAHAGGEQIADREVGRLRRLATPLIDAVERKPFAKIYEEEEEPPQIEAVTGRSLFTDEFSTDQAETAISSLQASTADMSVVQIRVLGGQVARVPAAATAFAHRDRPMIVNVVAAYADPDQRQEHEEWADLVQKSVRVGSRGAYVNFHADDSEESLRDIYPGATWHRLVEVKKDYDPDNLFQSNHNIVPGDR